MDVKKKIANALLHGLHAEDVRLDVDDGISGFVVSRLFEGVSAMDRQGKIDEALRHASLMQSERRQVLMIAGMTPEEYEAVGVRIRIHKIKEMAGGAVEILLHGGSSDAQYVRGALNNQKGVQTTEPTPIAGARGVLMSFRAKGTEAMPLTKKKAISALKKDRYIEVMRNV